MAPPPIARFLTSVEIEAAYLRLDATNIGGNAGTLRTGLSVYSKAEADTLLDDKADDDLSNVDAATGRTALDAQKAVASLTGSENQAVRQALLPVGFAQAVSGAGFAIDFAAEAAVQIRGQEGDTDATLTFTATNMAAGRSQVILLSETTSEDVALVFPSGWQWLTPEPATLFADTSGTLQVIARATNEVNVYAAWSAGI
jgi:hypothetical protein